MMENYKKIINLKGQVRGDVLLTDIKYIEVKAGSKKANRLKAGLLKIDSNYNFIKIKSTGWYPISWKVFLLMRLRLDLGWKDEDIVNMGENASKQSFIIKTILRYFSSLKMTFRETPRYWQRYWGAGELIPYKIDLEKKYLIIRIKNFKIHPDLCLYFKGHFKAITGLILSSENIVVEEKKCVFEGDEFEEYLITW